MSRRYNKPVINKNDVGSISKVFDKIYDDLNNLAEAAASSKDETSPRTEGRDGDLRVVKDKGGSHLILQARTSDGWANMAQTTFTESFDK